MKKIKYFFEFIPVVFFDALFLITPRPLAIWIGERIGLIFSVVLSSRRRLILKNLKNALPEKTNQEREEIAQKVWKNLGRTAIEFIKLPYINHQNYRDFIFYEGQANMAQAEAKGKGVILVAFHFTNWEMAGIANQFDRGQMVAIARPMKNPFVENWVQKKRRSCGMDVIYHRQAVRASLKALKDKKSIGVLVDQNLYQGGVFVDFFGQPAATTTLPALLHARTGAPVLVGYVLREKGKFRAIYGPPLKFPEIKDRNEQILEYTKIISKEVENVIRQTPENWFWIHNRWKRKPEVLNGTQQAQ